MTGPTPPDPGGGRLDNPPAGTRKLSVGSPAWMAAMEPHREMLQARARRMRTGCTAWLGVLAVGMIGLAVTAARAADAGQTRGLVAGAAGLSLIALSVLGMRIDWGRIAAVMDGRLPPGALISVRWRAVLEALGALFFSAVPGMLFLGGVTVLRRNGHLDAIGLTGAWVAGAALATGVVGWWFVGPGVRPLRVPADGAGSGGRAPGPADGQAVQQPPHPGDGQQHEQPEGTQQ